MVPVSLLFLRVRRDSRTPLTVQLIRQLRDTIVDGSLSPDDRLPSSRDLARRLGVSRNTVVAVYDALSAEGTIVVSPRKGPRVASVPRRAAPRSPIPVASQVVSRSAHRLASTIPEVRLDALMTRRPRSRPFGMGLPALELVPLRAFERCLVRRSRTMTSADALHDDPRGDLSLRRAVLRHVASTRGIRTTLDQVIITEGSQGALDLCCRVLLDAKHTVWTEGPEPLALRAAVRMTGARLTRIPVDERGVRVDLALQRAPDARAAFVSPAYAFPSGARLSLPRRLRLLEWATKTGAAIVEIDYEGELRSETSAPPPSLLGLDVEGANDCVLHVGTFSRSLLPALRLGFLIVPPSLVRPIARIRAASTRSAPYLLQAALADFIEEGHWARHMRRLEQATRRRRELVIAELRRLLPPAIAPRPPLGGAILTIPLPEDVDDVVLANALFAKGVDVLALGGVGLAATRRERIRARGLVLGIGAHSDVAIRRAAEVLAAAVRAALRRRD